jgi:nicotine blue oxidoreductase
MTVAALVLAAGESKRFGSSKQLADWLGVPLLQHVLSEVRTWPVDSIYVVLGSNLDEIVESVDFEGMVLIENPGWEEGMGSSVRVGLDALANAGGFDSVFVVMGDQPGIDVSVVERLLIEQKRTHLPVTIPRYRYTWGNPVLIERSLWPRIMATIEGDRGARSLFKAHPDWVDEVWFEDLAPRDIDTKMDLIEIRPRPRPG